MVSRYMGEMMDRPLRTGEICCVQTLLSLSKCPLTNLKDDYNNQILQDYLEAQIARPIPHQLYYLQASPSYGFLTRLPDLTEGWTYVNGWIDSWVTVDLHNLAL